METREARIRSLGLASAVGLAIPASLPLLEDELCLRDQDEAVSRLLCMHATAAAAFRFGKARALTWVAQENIFALLTGAERRFLEKGEGSPQAFIAQIEGMWALAWALGLVQELDFWDDCGDDFVAMLPDLRIGQGSSDLRGKANYRPSDEVVLACDLAYCLHWAIRQAQLSGNIAPAGLKPYVVVERRHALEWLLSTESWSDVSLDT